MVSGVAAEKREPTQKTRPRGKDAQGRPAKPVTIPVPTRGEVERDLDKLMGKKPARAKTEELGRGAE